MTLCQNSETSCAAAENQTLTHPSDRQRSISQSPSTVCGLCAQSRDWGKKKQNKKEIQKAQKEIRK